MAQVIQCKFSLFDEGRTYTGHHRKYILENAIKTCYAPETREKMKLREALGYLGHGRRELAHKLALSEVEVIKGPNGPLLVENVPSNVTTFFEIDKQGNVEHHQEILNTEPGKVVKALDSSKVGGFSWACGGFDGGAGGQTKITDFHGFDYVMNPGFAKNRGYIYESADSGRAHDLILENICRSAGITDKKAERYLTYWAATEHGRVVELQDSLETAAVLESALRGQIEEMEHRLRIMEAQKSKGGDSSRKSIILEGARKSVFVIPDRVVDSLISMSSEKDFNELIGFFESARKVNLDSLPVGNFQPITVKASPQSRESAEYGRAGSAPDFTAEPIFRG